MGMRWLHGYIHDSRARRGELPRRGQRTHFLCLSRCSHHHMKYSDGCISVERLRIRPNTPETRRGRWLYRSRWMTTRHSITRRRCRHPRRRWHTRAHQVRHDSWMSSPHRKPMEPPRGRHKFRVLLLFTVGPAPNVSELRDVELNG